MRIFDLHTWSAWIQECRWFEWIQERYWHLVPYEWRPFELWYRLKCRLWHKYTTVKPRHLPHTWTDRCTLMPHLMFEVLCQFIEREDPNPPEVYEEIGWHEAAAERRELFELYHWWLRYLAWNDEAEYQRVMADVEQPKYVIKRVESYGSLMSRTFSSPEAETRHNAAVASLLQAENDRDEELKRRCHRLVDLMHTLWT